MRIFMLFLALIWAVPSFSQPVGDSSCEVAMQAAWTNAGNANTEYTAGALKYFNFYFRFLNDVVLADPENVLCHFKKSMGIDPITLGTHTKTFGDGSINVVIETPTEAWASDYTYKGSVYVGAVAGANLYMSIWWAGSATTSKGYMVTKANSIMGDSDTNRMLNYIKWDNTGVDQLVRVYMTHFDSGGGYLTTASTSSSAGWGDMALYGAINYNSTTSAVTVQQVMIDNQRQGGTDGQFGCFRMIASGVKGGQIVVAKTDDARGGTGHAVSYDDTHLAATAGNQMDAVSLVDDVATANGTGSITAQELADEALTFHISCAALNSAGGVGQIFANGNSDTTLSPATVFPN